MRKSLKLESLIDMSIKSHYSKYLIQKQIKFTCDHFTMDFGFVAKITPSCEKENKKRSL